MKKSVQFLATTLVFSVIIMLLLRSDVQGYDKKPLPLQQNTFSGLDSLKLVVPIGHTSDCPSAAISSDNKYLITSSLDCKAIVWDFKSGKILNTLLGHTSGILSVSFNPANNLIAASAGKDSTIRVFNIQTGVTLFTYHRHQDWVNEICFSPDGKYLISGSRDSTARVIDVTSGKELFYCGGHSGGVDNVRTIPNSKYFASFDGSQILIWDYSSGKKIESFNGAGFDISKDGSKIITIGDDQKTINVYLLATGEKISTVQIVKDVKLERVCFNSGGNFAACTSTDSSGLIIDITGKKILHELKGHKDYLTSIQFSPDGMKVITASWDNSVRLWDADHGDQLWVDSARIGDKGSASITFDGKYILCIGEEIKLLNAIDGSLRNIYRGTSLVINQYCFTPDRKFYAIATSDNIITLVDAYTGKMCQKFVGHTQFVNSISFSPDGNTMVSSSGACLIPEYNDSIAIVWDVRTGGELYKLKHISCVNSVVFSPNGEHILTASSDHTAKLFDASTGKLVQQYLGGNGLTRTAYFSADGKRVRTRDAFLGNPLIYDTETAEKIETKIEQIDWINNTGQKKRSWADRAKGRGFFVSPDEHFFLLQTEDSVFCFNTDDEKIYSVRGNFIDFSPKSMDDTLGGTLFLTETELGITINETSTGKMIQTIKLPEVKLKSVSWGAHNKSFFIESVDGSLACYELRKFVVSNTNTILALPTVNFICLPVYERVQLENGNWIVRLYNSPYYMCSKDASKMLHYVTPSLRVLGFEQLDPVYNRPDIVLNEIGKYFGGADQQLVAQYREAWEKRVARLGLDKEKISRGDIAVPNASILNADEIIYDNTSGVVSLRVSANDPKYTLRRFNVLVNEVPVYGSSGISIAGLKKFKWDTTLTVSLSLGENKIQVVVMNELGLESFKYPVNVRYTSSDNSITARTYYIGIGVDRFQEKGHDLKFCVKDVTDLGLLLSQGKNTNVRILTNEQVTRENVIALKKFLRDSTTVNDRVIISCSSHGLLDSQNDFFLATCDVNFRDPSKRGLPYEELESLLDSIPARKKLLLLDACNSGENDKSLSYAKQLYSIGDTASAQYIAARGFQLDIEVSNISTFQMMNETFVNVSNNTGSVIISAAGGTQSALEGVVVDGNKIENGAFSWCVMECIRKSRLNKEAITVNKLKQITESRVLHITNGKQKPTSRQETFGIDWALEY